MKQLTSGLLQRKMRADGDGMGMLDTYLKERKDIVDKALSEFLPDTGTYPPIIFEAVRYSVFAGGKRLRPLLCIAAAEAVGGDSAKALPAACALELIHTYSLIHDDLPAMDDDDYRRGQLTNHKVYGEGIAILAGDALLTEAFHLLSRADVMDDVSPATRLRVVNEIAEAAGFFGMVAGQVVDLDSEGKETTTTTLEYIHSHKTEALITVSLRAGALLAGADDEALHAITEYGRKIGLAFQIADDILDIESSLDVLGKETGSDENRKKVTYPAIYGIGASRKKASECVEGALADLRSFNAKADPLRQIAQFIVERKS